MTFRWLLRIAAWLDKRFPPKVVVTQEQFDALEARAHRNNQGIAKLSGEILTVREQLAQCEKSLAALKEGIVKGDVPLTASERTRMRESFIKGEWPSRGGSAVSGAVPAGTEAR